MPDAAFIGVTQESATVAWAQFTSADCTDQSTGAVLEDGMVAVYVEVEHDGADELYVMATTAAIAATAANVRHVTTAFPSRGWPVGGATNTTTISHRTATGTATANFVVYWNRP